MTNGISGDSSVQFQAGNYASKSSAGTSKVKLDLNSVPENKVKVTPPSAAGEGKGLRLDIKA